MRTSPFGFVAVGSIALLASFTLGACSRHRDSGSEGTTAGSGTPASFYAQDHHPRPDDELRNQLGSFFLVEHYNVNVSKNMLRAIREHQPGGLVFWNPSGANAKQLRTVIRAYSHASKEAGQPPLLFSTDYEGGGLSLSTSGKSVPGVQRFRHGFTDLAHPVWLGRSMKSFGTELCYLHGRIMARELKSVGINYPLTMISDLRANLFLLRGVSKSPEKTAECLQAAYKGFEEQHNVVFVTKHFPGLGQTVSDTHDGVSISRAKTIEEADRHLHPFASHIKSVNMASTWPLYSIMASHALFPLYDDQRLTTESPIILETILREQLGFKGVVVSDAMWMGDYGHLPKVDQLAVYVNSFLSGMDMMMIPGGNFADAIRLFRAIYDDTVEGSMRERLENKTHLSWNGIRSRFLERIEQSLVRLNATRGRVGHAIDTMDGADREPKGTTSSERARYYGILRR